MHQLLSCTEVHLKFVCSEMDFDNFIDSLAADHDDVWRYQLNDIFTFLKRNFSSKLHLNKLDLLIQFRICIIIEFDVID